MFFKNSVFETVQHFADANSFACQSAENGITFLCALKFYMIEQLELLLY